jgi:hypothetical protein
VDDKNDAVMLAWGADKALERHIVTNTASHADAAYDATVEADADDAHDETVDAAMLAWGADEALERHFGRMTTNFKYAGYVLLHLIWGVFAWICFAYGRLCYNLLGPAATRDFSNSWGIGVALGQANDAQGVVTSALQAALLLTILEALWLVPNGRWLEGYVDFVSVQATVAQRGARRMFAVLSAYKRHSYAVS